MGQPNPRLRPRQARRRHHRAPRAQGRKAQDTRRNRAHPRSRRPRRRRRKEGPRHRRCHGRLGHDDHPETKNILVEAAWFDPATVRRSSQAPSPAHRRLAPLRARSRLQRPAHRLGARQQHHPRSRRRDRRRLVDVVIPRSRSAHSEAPRHHLRRQRSSRILGPTEDHEGITAAIAETILTGLGCTLKKNGTSPRTTHGARPRPIARRFRRLPRPNSRSRILQVTLPSWRLDLEREIDLIEEIARVYGYNRFRTHCPASPDRSSSYPGPKKKRPSAAPCSRLGWTEAISSTFCSATDAVTFAPQPNSAVAAGQSAQRRGRHAAPLARFRHARHACPQPEPRHGRRNALRTGYGLLWFNRQGRRKAITLAIGATGNAACRPEPANARTRLLRHQGQHRDAARQILCEVRLFRRFHPTRA